MEEREKLFEMYPEEEIEELYFIIPDNLAFLFANVPIKRRKTKFIFSTNIPK